MKNKKLQSLSIWSYRNASWRAARTLLHLIYCEWLELFGQKARDLYAIEYLGHSKVITIDEVLREESTIAAKKAADKLSDIELNSQLESDDFVDV